MSQTQERSGQSPTERAEELLDSIGQRIGFFAALTAQRIQQATTAIREEADRMDQPEQVGKRAKKAQTEPQREQNPQPVKERAEAMVDTVGARLGQYTAAASLQLQRATARLREEAEDVWVEAQHLRQQRSRPPQ